MQITIIAHGPKIKGDNTLTHRKVILCRIFDDNVKEYVVTTQTFDEENCHSFANGRYFKKCTTLDEKDTLNLVWELFSKDVAQMIADYGHNVVAE